MSQEPSPSRKRGAYSVDFKLEVVQFAKSVKSKQAASKHYNLGRTLVIEWTNQEDVLRKLADSKTKNVVKKRLTGGGRHLTFEKLDKDLAQWVWDMRSKKLRVSRRMIKIEGLRMFRKEEDNELVFTASNGWLDKFLERHNFRYRMPTTICQKVPSDYENLIIRFILYLSKIQKEKSYIHKYAADETGVWLDPQSGRCIDEKGAKEVSVLSTGHEKTRITVILTARDDGYKCLPYVLLPKKRVVPSIVEKYKNKLLLSWSGRTWMNDDITIDYLRRTFGISLFHLRLLVWDALRCHISVSTKNELRKLKIDTAVVPGGCTKFIQAPDVCWNEPFKAAILREYEDWMIHGEKETTAGGNLRAPSMDTYLDWILKGWNVVTKEMIVNSFKVCGLTNAPDGSEDALIHCFKPNGPIPSGREALKKARSEQQVSEMIEMIEEIDLDQDSENNNSDISIDC